MPDDPKQAALETAADIATDFFSPSSGSCDRLTAELTVTILRERREELKLIRDRFLDLLASANDRRLFMKTCRSRLIALRAAEEEARNG